MIVIMSLLLFINSSPPPIYDQQSSTKVHWTANSCGIMVQEVNSIRLQLKETDDVRNKEECMDGYGTTSAIVIASIPTHYLCRNF